jgi:membrane protease YdiL (CAAX protease family)
MIKPQPSANVKTAVLGFFISLLFGFVFSNLLTLQVHFENVPGGFGLPSLVRVLFSALNLQVPSSDIFDNWVVAFSSTLLFPIVLVVAKKMEIKILLFPVPLSLTSVLCFSLLTVIIGSFSYEILRMILGSLGLQNDIGSLFDYTIAVTSDKDKFPQVSLLWSIPVILVAPIYEELVFRGLLVESLNLYLPNRINCFVTALIFAAAHWGHFGDPSQMIVFVFGGILYFWAKESSGGFGLPIILHCIWNMCAITFYSHYIGS